MIVLPMRPTSLPRPSTVLPLLLVGALFLVAGCGSVDSVRTEAPETAAYDGDDPPATTIPLLVTLERSGGELPAEMSAFRFRVRELHFLGRDSTRWSRDAGRYQFSIPRIGSDPAVLVRTHVRPREIEELAIEIDRPYAEFGANAGGPLTVRDADSVRVELSGSTSSSPTAYVLRLRFDAGNSLDRDESCQWHFTPRFMARIEDDQAP